MERLTAHDSTSNVVANRLAVTVTFTIDELRLKATGEDDAKSRAEELLGNLMEELLGKTDLETDDLTCEVTVKELEEPCPSFCTEYTVLGLFLSYFINGDDSGMSDDELSDARRLEDQLGSKGHWSTPVLLDEGEFTSCDITGMHGTCYKLWWVDMEEVTRLASEQDKARAEVKG